MSLCGMPGAMVMSSGMPLCREVGRKSSPTCRTVVARSKLAWLMVSLPASTRERSRMSESRRVRRLPDWIARSAYSACSWFRSVRPLSGVLISWLMLARNSDLALLAVSAASLAVTSSWMSTSTPLRTRRPLPRRRGAQARCRQRVSPEGIRTLTSALKAVWVARAAASRSASMARSSFAYWA